MATTSQAPQFKADLVTALRAGLPGVQVEYAWPGPNTESECVYLDRVEGTVSYPALMAGRKMRQEDYTVDVVIWVHQPDTSPLAFQECESRAFQLRAAIEDALAADPGFSSASKWALEDSFETEPQPYEHGWAIALTLQVSVMDRLS